jgi:hypothetical protein
MDRRGPLVRHRRGLQLENGDRNAALSERKRANHPDWTGPDDYDARGCTLGCHRACASF